MKNIWYAVQADSTDDWGYGSYDYDEAVEMLNQQGKGQIAVINEVVHKLLRMRNQL